MGRIPEEGGMIRGEALEGGTGLPSGAILCTTGRLNRFGEPGKLVS